MKTERLTMKRLYHVLDTRVGTEFAIRDILPFLDGHSQRIVASAIQRFKDRGLLKVARLVKNKQSRYAIFAKTDLFFLGLAHAARPSQAGESVQEDLWSYRPLEDAFRRLVRLPKRLRKVRGVVAQVRRNRRVLARIR